MDAVVADDHVDGGVQLDAGDLVAVELPLDRDVVDVVVLDGGEHAAEVTDDAVLAAVVDGVAADDVGADVLAVPADLAGGEHRLELVLVAGLVAAHGGEVVTGGDLLADGDRRALRVVDDVVLDDPALGPVRTDQTGLVGGRRRPRGRGLGELEPADGDVVEVMLGRVEDRAADVDLDEFGVRVRAAEVGPDRRLVRADLGVPDQLGLLGVADPVDDSGPVVDRLGAQRRIRHLVDGGDLVEAGPVEVDLAQMLLRGGLVGVDDPVAVDLLGERVERAEQCVRHGDRPDVTADPVPAGDRLGALDHDVLARGGGVGDATEIAEPAPLGLDPLAVLPAVDDDGVPGLGEGRCPVDGAERSVLGAVGVIGSGGRDVEHGWHFGVDLSSRRSTDLLEHPLVLPSTRCRRCSAGADGAR